MTRPRGSLLTGNLSQFARDPLTFLENAAREHGPFVPLRFGRTKAVLLNDPALIEEVLVTQRENFMKARSIRALHHLFGRGLLTNEGESWRKQRRLAQPAFSPRALSGHSQNVVSHATTALDAWEDGSVIDVHHEMKHLLMRIIAAALFGADLSEEAATIGMALEAVMDRYAARRGAARFAPDWVPLPATRRYVEGVNNIEAFVMRVIESRRGEVMARRDLMHMLLASRDENGQLMPSRQIRDEAITLFVGGFDTPALAMSWTWYLLATHPDAARRLVSEVDAVIGKRAPSYEKLERLKFADAVIKESMRLYPPAWIIGREAISDTIVAGRKIPAGTAVLISQWVMHRDEKFFAQPDRFVPERWLDEQSSEIPRFAYFPFGGGPRVCIGASFAMMETTLILAMLAQRFEFNVEPGATVSPRAAMTLRPRDGVPARVIRR